MRYFIRTSKILSYLERETEKIEEQKKSCTNHNGTCCANRMEFIRGKASQLRGVLKFIKYQ